MEQDSMCKTVNWDILCSIWRNLFTAQTPENKGPGQCFPTCFGHEFCVARQPGQEAVYLLHLFT